MKKNKRHIIHAWVLLLCFIAGQYMVYAHQHKFNQGSKQAYSASKHQAGPTVVEKCQLCDAMHHYNAVNNTSLDFTLVTVTDYFYPSPVYSFTSLSLILAGGRAPPVAGLSV